MAGFTQKDIDMLETLKAQVEHEFTYETDQDKFGLDDYWEDDKVLKPSVVGNSPISADCEEYAMISMRKAVAAGFKARLVIGLDETKAGHCICEVASSDGTQSYFFDNRRKVIATQHNLLGYYFYSCSPWNPTPGDTRPWNLIGQNAN